MSLFSKVLHRSAKEAQRAAQQPPRARERSTAVSSTTCGARAQRAPPRAPRKPTTPKETHRARRGYPPTHPRAAAREQAPRRSRGDGGSWSGTSAGQPGAAPPPLSPLSPRIHPHCVALSLSGACGVLEGGHSRTQRRDRAWERLKGIGWGEVIGCVGAPPLTPAPTRAPERLTPPLRCPPPPPSRRTVNRPVEALELPPVPRGLVAVLLQQQDRMHHRGASPRLASRARARACVSVGARPPAGRTRTHSLTATPRQSPSPPGRARVGSVAGGELC